MTQRYFLFAGIILCAFIADELMALHTGQSLEQIERDTERDRFLSAPEAVEYGLVDSILTHRN